MKIHIHFFPWIVCSNVGVCFHKLKAIFGIIFDQQKTHFKFKLLMLVFIRLTFFTGQTIRNCVFFLTATLTFMQFFFRWGEGGWCKVGNKNIYLSLNLLFRHFWIPPFLFKSKEQDWFLIWKLKPDLSAFIFILIKTYFSALSKWGDDWKTPLNFIFWIKFARSFFWKKSQNQSSSDAKSGHLFIQSLLSILIFSTTQNHF